MNAPTVADEMVFAALPDETKAAIERLYGGAPDEFKVDLEMVAKAYKAGFDDAVEEISFVEPSCTDREALRAAADIMAVKTPDALLKRSA